MSIVTIYQKYSPKSPKYFKSINYVLNRIRDGKSKELIYKIRSTGDIELKKELPSILFSGTFSYRNDKSCTKHSGFICLDFDKFPTADLMQSWRDSLEGDEYTYSVFTSPSGKGLKCIVKIPPIIENHKGYFEELRKYYNCEYFDFKSCNLSRICFESYDPNLTVNESSKVWEKCAVFAPIVLEHNGEVNEDKAVKILLKWWVKKYGLAGGNRNNNMFILCAAFNDAGVNKDYALSIASTFQEPDFTLFEIEAALKSAYKKTERFGTLTFTDAKR